MIPNQTFHCPKCGAPGQVLNGQTEYSCECRFGALVANGGVTTVTLRCVNCGQVFGENHRCVVVGLPQQRSGDAT